MADKVRLVIVGGGVAGLIAHYVSTQHHNVQATILEAGKVGGEWLAGGLRYIHDTIEVKAMLHDVGAVFTSYVVEGGIHLHGSVKPYPEVLRGMDPEMSRRIQHDHWRKTRRTEPDASFSSKSMNDPEAMGQRSALRCDALDVIERLAHRASIQREAVTEVHPGEVLTKSGARFHYDYLLWTAPLWVAKQVMFFRLPDALALRLNVVYIEPQKVVHDKLEKGAPGASVDPYARWDYIYTPYTPDGLIHRIYPHEDGYACEFNGAWAEGDPAITVALTSDLNFLFPRGWSIRRVVRGINGHLLPLEYDPVWPSHIQPLGRFAQWDSRATADVVLGHAFSLASQWGWRPCQID